MYFIALTLNLPFAAVVWKKPLAGAVASVALAVAIIHYQVVLTKRLIDVQAEATRIVAFAYRIKNDSGTFPSDLSGYSFTNPAVTRFFQRYTRLEKPALAATATIAADSEGTRRFTSPWMCVSAKEGPRKPHA